MCGSLEIDSAIDTVKGLSYELAEAKREAGQGKLVPLPGESVESCALELGATSKTVGSSMAQLLTAANQGGCGLISTEIIRSNACCVFPRQRQLHRYRCT